MHAARSAWRQRLDRFHTFRTVSVAATIGFVLDALLSGFALHFGWRDFAVLVPAYLVSFLLYFFIGRWIGKRSWPGRGKRLARWMIHRRALEKRENIFLSDRPDRTLPTPLRVWEVVAFAAGLSVIINTTLVGFGRSPGEITLRFVIPIFLVWGSFVLVPYWLFTQLGFRQVDPIRWLVLPLSRTYADRLNLSNGLILITGAGAAYNLAFREGASTPGAVFVAAQIVLQTVLTVIVLSATATAYYLRRERHVAQELEADCIQLGIRDGRGMSDGEFLPRLPPRKAP